MSFRVTTTCRWISITVSATGYGVLEVVDQPLYPTHASADYRHALAQSQTLPSMSRKACCYDNAAMESFWSTLKLELVYRRGFKTRAEARLAIFDFIEAFYNRQRLHSSLNYICPVDFENQNN